MFSTVPHKFWSLFSCINQDCLNRIFLKYYLTFPDLPNPVVFNIDYDRLFKIALINIYMGTLNIIVLCEVRRRMLCRSINKFHIFLSDARQGKWFSPSCKQLCVIIVKGNIFRKLPTHWTKQDLHQTVQNISVDIMRHISPYLGMYVD